MIDYDPETIERDFREYLQLWNKRFEDPKIIDKRFFDEETQTPAWEKFAWILRNKIQELRDEGK